MAMTMKKAGEGTVAVAAGQAATNNDMRYDIVV